ncbi:DUF6514 family protein [Thermobrachium celere]|uniref:Uncharacterized protein n=1 Tax=Thermobrachium celere DSM 8682 TaxID=941824 RepID=R7RR13_9CLOT|nr:DUF6514 family protein [Thermobrachium celere]GFR35659.1 hypothetical protein TCEA9_14710 [Thermobrachium celere]CDF57695.1 hypothetical protein TCEL_01609 [Thermobrachium celere DSM 8682]
MRDVVEIASCRTILDDNKSYVYKYYLVKNCKKINVGDDEFDIKCFGIEVLREEIVDDKVISIEKNWVDYVSTDRTKVLELIIYLQKNEVSPVHLVEIIGEYVDEWVSDFDNEVSKIEAKLVLA